MAGKRLLFKSAVREKVLSGASALADAERITLGAKSKCVLIQKKWGRPVVCNDGITIAKEVEPEDPEANVGAQMIREAAERTGETVGDGTSTLAILAHAIFSEGLHNVAAGSSTRPRSSASLLKTRCPWRVCCCWPRSLWRNCRKRKV